MSLITKDGTGRSIPIVFQSEDPFSSDNYNMYRIIIIKSGSGIINLNDASFVIVAPTVICLNEKDEISLEKDNSIDAEIIYFLPTTIHDAFSIDDLNKKTKQLHKKHIKNFSLLLPFIHRTESFKGILSISFRSIKRLTNLSSALEKETSNFENGFWPCRSRSFFLEILFLLQYILTDNEKNDTIPLVNVSSELKEVLLYLHTNYSDKITVQKLAKKFNINRTTLSENFLAEIGQTIKQYIIQIRIKVASMLLKDTLIPISEITYRVGYNNSTHFTRTFKKHLDMLPSEYRKTMSEL